MKKLLHERLREIPDDAVANDVYGDGYRLILFGYECQALADEIERYYIPRPRFENGEPAQWHDELENGEPLCAITYDDGGVVSINSETVNPEYELIDGEMLKRPQPKVFDADGVEIKVGDTVWFNEEPTVPLKVTGFMHYSGKVIFNEGSYCSPEHLTHKEPVLDADGVPIKVGDTVWRIEDGLQMSVIAVGEEALKQSCEVLTEIDGKQPYHYNGSELTHKEPDSLEKLRDDMAAYADGGISCIEDDLHMFADRLSALIERGA